MVQLTLRRIKMKFEICDGVIKDYHNDKEYQTLEEICDLLNMQEEEKMDYKRRLKTLKYKIQKIIEVENV